MAGLGRPDGRRRLRNLLNRVRATCGELVARDGEALVLAPDADVDARGFEDAAAAVGWRRTGERAGLARAALARYEGELLPADRYEAWASAPRERLRRRYLDLLDLLADDARRARRPRRGDPPARPGAGRRAARRVPLRPRRRAAALPGPPRVGGGARRPGAAAARGPRPPRDPHAHPPARRRWTPIGRLTARLPSMLVTLIVRLLPDPLAAGELVGEVENVESGQRTLVRDLGELMKAAQAAAPAR